MCIRDSTRSPHALVVWTNRLRIRLHCLAQRLPSQSWYCPIGEAFDGGSTRRQTDKGSTVFLDGTRLPIKDFSNYVDLFLKDKTEPVKIYEKVSALSNHVYQSCAMRDSRCIFPCAAGLVSGAPTR
eukprot:541678-Pyramimonas_sp.AAC.1